MKVKPRVQRGENERRVVAFDAIETRDNDDGGFTFEGHAAVFDELSENLGGFREKIERGAFRKVLKSDPDVRFLINHNADLVLARTHAGTLKLSEDTKGLKVVADVAPVSYAHDLRVLLDRGDVSQMSFAFRVADDEWEENDDGVLIRTVREYSRLSDVSAVTYPAYPQTDASVRSIAGVEVLRDGEVDADAVREVAWKLHRGEVQATTEERQALDELLARCSTVSPWIAERTFRAVASEPELLAAMPGKRVTIELEDVQGQPDPRLAAMQRRLRLRERELD
jgi:HK97 family phage prohead protease